MYLHSNLTFHCFIPACALSNSCKIKPQNISKTVFKHQNEFEIPYIPVLTVYYFNPQGNISCTLLIVLSALPLDYLAFAPILYISYISLYFLKIFDFTHSLANYKLLYSKLTLYHIIVYALDFHRKRIVTFFMLH